MARFVRGDVVVVPFPFSDLSQSKRRPAMVLAKLDGDDVILCQITTRKKSDRYSIALDSSDMSQGKLTHPSNIRPNRIFTADSRLVVYSVGHVNVAKLDEVVAKVVEIIS